MQPPSPLQPYKVGTAHFNVEKTEAQSGSVIC